MIALSKRFGIGKLSDDVPLFHRHIEAALPDYQHLISEPIRARVAISASTVGSVLRNVQGVIDVAIRRRLDESLDAYVSVVPQSNFVVRDITTYTLLLIPGYAIPNHVYLIRGRLARDLSGSGRYDYDRTEEQALANETIEFDKRQLFVRHIFADILDIDPTHMRKDSNFFLLGGNSLLLGKLPYHLRSWGSISESRNCFPKVPSKAYIAILIEEKRRIREGLWY